MLARKTIPPSVWNRKRIQELLKAVKGRKVLVIGDVGVDRYTEGEVERISPEAPVPVVQVQSERLKLGLAANVADNVRELGGIPFLVGLVGKDRSCDDFKKLLRERKIRSDFLVTDPGRRTALKERIVTESQQLLRIDYETVQEVSASIQRQIIKNVQALIPRVDAVVLEDYGKGLLSRAICQAVISLSLKAGVPILSDPSGKVGADYYHGSTVITPNKKEAEFLSGRNIFSQNNRSLSQGGQVLLEKSQAQHAIITLGKDGMAVFSQGEKDYFQIPTFAQEVYDVSGAGDTVISVLALGLASGALLQEAAILSNIAAGIEVSKRGTATVQPSEIVRALNFK